MNIITRIANWFKSDNMRSAYPVSGSPLPPPSLASSPRQGGNYELFGMYDNTSMSVATVYRCVTLLAESVASLPLLYLRKTGNIFQTVEDSRLVYLMTVQPNEEMSAFDFWAAAVQEVLLDGNAYIYPMYSPVTMNVDRLILLNRGSVCYNNGEYIINDAEHGIHLTCGVDELIHIKGKTAKGNIGQSVLAYAQSTIDIAATGNAQTKSNYQTGGMVRGIVGNSSAGTQGFGEYQDAELSKAASDVDAEFRSGKRIVSLPGQVDFKQISLSAADMQFLDSRKFSVVEICRFFGVHPSFVFHDTSSNYKSAEMANVSFLSSTLNPILRKIEIELSRKLISQKNFANQKIMFDRESLYTCDLASKADYQVKQLSAGICTVNELRRKENRPDVEGGDATLVSANLRTVRDIIQDENGEEKE